MLEEAIIEQNPWWRVKESILEDEKVKEALSKNKKLIYEFKDRANKIIFGPRQTGKTTYFKLLIYDLIFNKNIDPKSVCYFSCEILRNFKELVELVRKIDLLSEGKKYIFLDEVTFVEEWQRAIKYILDSPLSKNKIFYITGSSSINLKKENFPGRDVKIEEFLPLTFRQFLGIFGSPQLKRELRNIKFKSLKEIYENSQQLLPHKNEIEKLFYKFLECGGFPRAFYELMENGKIREETYSIYWKWLIHDIAKINRSEKIATGVLYAILKNYGTKFSLSSISKETEIGSHVTVREYLEILEDLFAVRNFYTFDINKKKVLYRKMRKSYFVDPFLFYVVQRELTGIKKLQHDKVVEGLVVEAMIRRLSKHNIGFYHNKKEIDICFGNFGIEIKWQENVDKRDFPNVNIKRKILLSKNDSYFDEKNNILILPAHMFLSLV